ncbi:hypothetical protein FCH62_23275 [Salmonella enterica]|nr:hypothetical protein [Salmonella enterica]
MTSNLKFIRLRVEPELIQPINNLASIRDEMKAEIAGEIVEWFLARRSDGTLTARYFSSPKDADYVGIRLHRSTVMKVKQLSLQDNQPINRIIYTALARYFEQQ